MTARSSSPNPVRVYGLLFIVVAVFAALAVMILPLFSAKLKLVNHSGEMLTAVTVTASGQTFPVGDLAPGEERTVTLVRYTDSSWVIDGRWSDGAPFTFRFGYITHNMNFRDTAWFEQARAVRFEPQVGR